MDLFSLYTKLKLRFTTVDYEIKFRQSNITWAREVLSGFSLTQSVMCSSPQLRDTRKGG